MTDKVIIQPHHFLKLCLEKSTYGQKNGFGIKPNYSEIQKTERSEISHTKLFIQKNTTAAFTNRK